MSSAGLPDKYEILGELGAGGMGLVYHARDQVLNREVAIKVMSEQLAANPEFSSRFLTEARAAASLNHPSIVQIYEFGEAGDGHFLAMEFVRGHTLKDELKDRVRFTEAQTIALILEACRTLAFAHRAGIVHRDVKPDNMMFTEHNDFKLVDLGLAKCLHESSSNTMTGQAMGTPHFVSPEQIMGLRDIDARADVYSLGATMYNLATGSVPFDGSSSAHVMAKHLNDPLPDPRKIAPGLSGGFCRILGTMMAKDPNDRYPDMDAVERDLVILQEGGEPSATGPVPTAVQETVFTSFPPAVEWDDEAIEKVTQRLVEAVGPMGKVLVRKATTQAAGWDELSTQLAGYVDEPAERKTFLQACERIGEGGGTKPPHGRTDPPADRSAAATMPLDRGAATMPIGSHTPPPPPRPAFTLDETQTGHVVGLLAQRIGPVARALVRREAPGATSMSDLTKKLAASIPDEGDRKAFVEAMSRLG
jgi:serine/threonine-protein kinase